jgi:cobyrinic acid a,c-diamide synthase
VSAVLDVPRIVIAGAASGVGKTTVTAGLIAALRGLGHAVQPFKCGPDYIDPSYHERAAGRPCRNLDTWMLDEAPLLEGFARACRDVDLAVIEGVMGLFDGSDWHSEQGSTAQIAKLFRAPVLLVVDIRGSARSAAVPVLGCQHFDPAVELRAVALNFAGSEGHAAGCSEAITRAAGLPVLGWLPREQSLRIPERHLGLTPGGEQEDADALIGTIAAEVTRRFDLDGVLRIARSAPSLVLPARSRAVTDRSVPGERRSPAGSAAAPRPAARSARRRPVLAVARDPAFCFYYPENLELLADAGAEIEFFSPLRLEYPSARASGVYLGGGYPELHGRALASNTSLWERLQELRAGGCPIYAECGGFMALTQRLIDLEGNEWRMAGLIPGTVRMSDKLVSLGYRTATALGRNLIAAAGESFRGHEFRYSSWAIDAGVVEGAWRVSRVRSAGEETVGYADESILASYLHLHFGQQAAIAETFVRRLGGSVTEPDIALADRD